MMKVNHMTNTDSGFGMDVGEQILLFNKIIAEVCQVFALELKKISR